MQEQSELIVGRAWSWKADVLRRQAETDMQERVALDLAKVYSISVFAMEQSPTETFDDAVARLGQHILNYVNSKWLGVTTTSDLKSEGFELELNEPPPLHHDVMLGTVLTQESLDTLEGIFNRRERTRLVNH